MMGDRTTLMPGMMMISLEEEILNQVTREIEAQEEVSNRIEAMRAYFPDAKIFGRDSICLVRAAKEGCA